LVGSVQGSGLIYRGDGSNFDPVPFTGDVLHGVWGSGPNDVWVAPLTGALQHWNGTGWTSSAALGASGQTWHGLSGSGSDDVWVVGDQGLTAHYASGRWAVSRTPTTATLFGVWSARPSTGWLVGGNGTALRWDGDGWK
jgi:hypothetical protein